MEEGENLARTIPTSNKSENQKEKTNSTLNHNHSCNHSHCRSVALEFKVKGGTGEKCSLGRKNPTRAIPLRIPPQQIGISSLV